MPRIDLRIAILIGAAAWAAPAFCGDAASGEAAARPAEALYLQLGRVGLDPGRVYRVRGAAIERPSIHITLEDGTIGFTQDVLGRITGAFFEGEGEVLLVPPDKVERNSMSAFTGMAILEERFSTAYFRFNDETAAELRPDLRVAEDGKEFVTRWSDTARNLSQNDAMRLLVSFSRMLPAGDGVAAAGGSGGESGDRILHARLSGTKLGVFDVFFDAMATEQVEVGQARAGEDGVTYYDVWASFALPIAGALPAGAPEDSIMVRRYEIATSVKPPTEIHSKARLQIDVRRGGARTLLFELSRFLQIASVEMDGHTVEFIHNPAVEGTQLSRRGNDIVAVVLPERARAGQKIELQFVYGGEVMAEAGKGLLYVGARGTWYPNRGLAMSDFDLEFHFPAGWTLVATGKPSPISAEASTSASSANNTGEQVGRWVSERSIPVAGFNLGKYKVATAQAGNIVVEAYATSGVERDFPVAREQLVPSDPGDVSPQRAVSHLEVPRTLSPARNEMTVAAAGAQAIEYYAQRFGPYPYSKLALTQMPGRDSQGWPGLVFLSSYAFLSDEERTQLHFDSVRVLFQKQIPAHETAHQWWGDLVTWKSYRDQWFSEGLANYSALMMLQEKDPTGFREVMERYRRDLVEENKDGVAPKDAGPVTLGGRLLSSRYTQGYEAISYGRGTWLFYMLRSMMQDAVGREGTRQPKRGVGADEPFVRALRKLRERYEGKAISTRELLDVFSEELPPSLRYEGKQSLDWFLEGWVNGTALPRLEVKAVRFTPKAGSTTVSGTILQKDAPEDLVTSVPVYAFVTGKQPVLLGRVFADGAETPFHLSAPAGAHKIVLDPNGTVLTAPK